MNLITERKRASFSVAKILSVLFAPLLLDVAAASCVRAAQAESAELHQEEAVLPNTDQPVLARDKRDQIEQELLAVHKKQRNVGLSAAVFLRGKRVYTGTLGFADLEHQVPVRPEPLFAVASVTKAFTGIALLKLHEAGKIDLDAPIQRYVPGFPEKPEGVITSRLLAANLAGIRHWHKERAPALYSTHYDDVAKVLALFKDDPLVARPGSKYSYSSYGYNLLAAGIQSAAQTPFQRYVEETILRPLELENTRFDDVRRVIPNRSRCYSFYDPITYAESSEVLRVPDRDYSHNMAGGNMLATAEDLGRFGRALTHPGFMTQASVDLLYTRAKTASVESAMSFGWFVSKAGATRREIRITGSNPGVQGALHVYPAEDLVVAILSNTWGLGSASGEMATTLPERVAAICMGWPLPEAPANR
jgi:CubicO group peptidase (beta-lactamase class C family)